MTVSLYKDKKVYRISVSRLILGTFVGKCPDGMECCHNNGNKSDNRLENLRWDTRCNNQKDRIKHNTSNKGENHGNSKLTEQNVRIIIYMYMTGLFTQKEIGKIYGVHLRTVSYIIARKRWKHIWSK